MPSESFLQKFLIELYSLVYKCMQEIQSLYSKHYITEDESEIKFPNAISTYLSNPEPNLLKIFKPIPSDRAKAPDIYNDEFLEECESLIRTCESLSLNLRNSNLDLQVSSMRVKQYQEAIKSLLLL